MVNPEEVEHLAGVQGLMELVRAQFTGEDFNSKRFSRVRRATCVMAIELVVAKIGDDDKKVIQALSLSGPGGMSVTQARSNAREVMSKTDPIVLNIRRRL